MNKIWQLGLFCFALLYGYLAVAVAVATWFSYWYSAWWLFVVTVLVDAYLGAFDTLPIMSMYMGVFVLCVEFLKLHLLGVKNE